MTTMFFKTEEKFNVAISGKRLEMQNCIYESDI